MRLEIRPAPSSDEAAVIAAALDRLAKNAALHPCGPPAAAGTRWREPAASAWAAAARREALNDGV